MAIKNLGTITSIQQKKNSKKIEKSICIRMDLNTKADKDEEYNIYIIDTEKAALFPIDQEIKVDNKFEVSLNKKYDFELDKDQKSIIGLTEISKI